MLDPTGPPAADLDPDSRCSVHVKPAHSAPRRRPRLIKHRRTKPYRPATTGKAERFNRTLLDEWAYARLWTSEASRARAKKNSVVPVLFVWLGIANGATQSGCGG